MKARPRLAFFGSSLVSTYWNGAATYYRGILSRLAERGLDITFFEPNAYERQQNRDLPTPNWCRLVVYEPTEAGVAQALEMARESELVAKASGVGVFDTWLEREVPRLRGRSTSVLYWDVDAPATLERMQADPDDPFRAQLPGFDLVLTYGGGERVVRDYTALGARACAPVYNALDPLTHHPAPPEERFRASLSLLANRLPDRVARINAFLFEPARKAEEHHFLLGGSGWEKDVDAPANVHCIGHVPSTSHNAFNSSPLAVLSVNRESMARTGYSPATRIFEAAGAGACLISDRWEGMEAFLEPGREVLLASDGEEVLEHLRALHPARAREIGGAALQRVLAEHTYDQRAEQVLRLLAEQRLCGTEGLPQA